MSPVHPALHVVGAAVVVCAAVGPAVVGAVVVDVADVGAAVGVVVVVVSWHWHSVQ